MFNVDEKDLMLILADYGMDENIVSVSELLRYHYEKYDPNSKEVRLILKLELGDGGMVVVKFKNEVGVTKETMEQQSVFSSILEANGIRTPHAFSNGKHFVAEYTLHGYEVLVTVEEFKCGEVKLVDERISEQTGALLAKTHNIAERLNCHVDCPVLFNPFKRNDLMFVNEFIEAASGLDKHIFGGVIEAIMGEYERRMARLEKLKDRPCYAVQGDISDCNLYMDADGELGLFDFNRCGDNILFCDAIMQAVFEARLMDYPESAGDGYEEAILNAFLRGYNAIRPFSDEERRLFSDLYAVIDAFWGMKLIHGENNFLELCRKGDEEELKAFLEDMRGCILADKVMQI